MSQLIVIRHQASHVNVLSNFHLYFVNGKKRFKSPLPIQQSMLECLSLTIILAQSNIHEQGILGLSNSTLKATTQPYLEILDEAEKCLPGSNTLAYLAGAAITKLAKSVCLQQAFRLIYLQVRKEPNRVEQFSLGPYPTRKYQIRPERFARDKRSSLFFLVTVDDLSF